MLLMVEKRISGAICHVIHRYTKANNKYIKDYDKNKGLSYLKYWDINNLYGRTISQKLPVNKFEWTEDSFLFNEDFINKNNEESDVRYFLEFHVQYPESYMNFIRIYCFYQKE